MGEKDHKVKYTMTQRENKSDFAFKTTPHFSLNDKNNKNRNSSWRDGCGGYG